MNGENLPDYLEIPRADGAPGWRIARRLREARGAGRDRPGLVWLGGFASDMRGAKASFVDAYAAAQGRALLRFDYSGHGESAFDTPGGRFEDGAIGDWLEQSLALFEVSTRGPQILIGTSMGAWIALLLARRLNEIRASRPTARAAAAGSRGRFHRGIAMEDASRDGSAADRGKGRICAAIPLWADPDAHHPAPGGGRSRPPFAWRSGARPCADAHHSGSSWTRTCLGVTRWPSRIVWWTTR